MKLKLEEEIQLSCSKMLFTLLMLPWQPITSLIGEIM